MRRIGEWLLSNIVSLGAAVVSVIAIVLTLQQQAQKTAVLSNRLYFGSYTIGQKMEDLKNSLGDKNGQTAARQATATTMQKFVRPIEFSLGIHSALAALTVEDLKIPDKDPSSPGSLYFDAAASKYDDLKVTDAFYIGQIDSDLTYANGQKHLGSWWSQEVGSPNKDGTLPGGTLNWYLQDAGFKCGLLDARINANSFKSLNLLTECLWQEWGVSATPSPSPR